jgi:hypothetical protein
LWYSRGSENGPSLAIGPSARHLALVAILAGDVWVVGLSSDGKNTGVILHKGP